MFFSFWLALTTVLAANSSFADKTVIALVTFAWIFEFGLFFFLVHYLLLIVNNGRIQSGHCDMREKITAPITLEYREE